jgi:ubiquinone/menaquinone biosynthesis C-methylase UbiE
MDIRKEEEKRFHDELRTNSLGQRWSLELEDKIQNDPLWSNMKYYSIERKSRQVVLEWFETHCKGKKILDFCCGNGDDSFILVDKGAVEVTGIDISEVSIDNCRRKAERDAYKGKMSFQVMDAENLNFNDNTFNIVTEYGTLHHLDLDKAYSQIARVLQPEGECICVETLGHNPLIALYRRLTPELRTEWEADHILRKNDIYKAAKYFKQVEILGLYHLFTLAAVPFRRFSFFEPVLSMFEILDRYLLRIPGIKWQAWQAVFILSNPKK